MQSSGRQKGSPGLLGETKRTLGSSERFSTKNHVGRGRGRAKGYGNNFRWHR